MRSSDCSSASTSTFAKPSCLVVAKDSDQSIQSIKRIAENLGWRVITANGDGEDVLRLLKLRNWDAVFLSIKGADCIQRFRQWESRTRSHIQKHVYMLSDSSSASLPQGFDGTFTSTTDIRRCIQAKQYYGYNNRVSKSSSQKGIWSQH